MDLLEKTRAINRLIQKAAGGPVNFEEVAQILSEAINCNAHVLSRKGKILGYRLDRECEMMLSEVIENGYFPESYNEWLMGIESTLSNYERDNEDCIFDPVEECLHTGRLLSVVPIVSGGNRLGTLLIVRFEEPLSDEDLILVEYAATVIALEIMRGRSETIEEEARRKAQVQVAMNTLSYSEMEALEHLLDELDGEEGLLVASEIADRIGITRSVFVNALRKFESAGVLESRSLGRKGTYVKILNKNLLDEMEKIKEGA